MHVSPSPGNWRQGRSHKHHALSHSADELFPGHGPRGISHVHGRATKLQSIARPVPRGWGCSSMLDSAELSYDECLPTRGTNVHHGRPYMQRNNLIHGREICQQHQPPHSPLGWIKYQGGFEVGAMQPGQMVATSQCDRGGLEPHQMLLVHDILCMPWGSMGIR